MAVIKSSIVRAENGKTKWSIIVAQDKIAWSTSMDRVKIIRKGLPYESIEVISKKADCSIKEVLRSLGLPQTTYNKKRRTMICSAEGTAR